MALVQYTWSDDIEHRIPLSHLGSTHSRTTLGVVCHHLPWYYTRSDDVERGMPLLRLESIHNQTTWDEVRYHCSWTKHTIGRHRSLHASKALGQHSWSDDVGCVIQSSPLGSIDGRTMSDMTCHHCTWEAHTVRRHWAWHAIINLGKHTRSN